MAVAVTAVAVSALALSACSGARPPAGAGTGDLAVTTSETFDTPQPEPTTVATSSQSTRHGGNPAISVARLPVGGDSEDSETDPTRQCAHVTWIASQDGQIPTGAAVEITRVHFHPNAFQVVSGGCRGDLPSCVHYIFRTGTLRCDLAVRAVRDVPSDVAPTLGFSGLVYCPSNESTACSRFVAALSREQQQAVSLNAPPPRTTSQPPSTTGETSTTSAPTDPTTSGG
jgi:hypothetical protein